MGFGYCAITGSTVSTVAIGSFALGRFLASTQVAAHTGKGQRGNPQYLPRLRAELSRVAATESAARVATEASRGDRH